LSAVFVFQAIRRVSSPHRNFLGWTTDEEVPVMAEMKRLVKVKEGTPRAAYVPLDEDTEAVLEAIPSDRGK